jgi:hypothetical protein
MVTPPDTDSGRVTLALLGQKIDNLSDKVDDYLERMACVEAVVHQHDMALVGDKGRMEREAARLDGRIDRVEDRVKGWQAGQGVFTALASAVAAWLGMRS